MAKNNRFSDDPVVRVRRPDGTEVPLSEADPSKIDKVPQFRKRKDTTTAEAPIPSKKPS